jgi:hypothetical protein
MMIPSTPIPAADHVGPAEDTGLVVASTRIGNVLHSPQLMTFLVLLGVALLLWEYAWNKSLYLDEILLSRSILDLPLGDLLTKPLLLDQVAPRGFLFVERLVVMIIGQSELALRLFPFVCAVTSVILFRRLAVRVLTGVAPAFALLLFAIGVPFIRFGVEVKQYSLDITAAIGLTLLALDLLERESSTKRLLVFGVVGFVVVWFSQASVLVMAGLGLGVAVDWVISRDRRPARGLLITISLWAVASFVAVVVGLRSMTPATREFMDDFWAGGFFPLPLRSPADLHWFWDRLVSLFSDPSLMRYRWPAAFLVVALLGFVALWQRSRPAALLLLGPFVVCMAAAIAHQYPFRGRLIVWLLPALLLAVAAGTEWIWHKVSLLHPVLGGALMIAFLVPPGMALAEAPPPYEIEHHRALLSYLQRHRQPGDFVYVFPLQRIGTIYYGPRYGLLPNEWTTGICERDDTRAYIKDIDRFRGVPRLWVLSASTRPFRVARASVQSYLKMIGFKKESLSFPSLTMGSASIELYDLSDPARLDAATADTFPVPPMPTDPSPGCRDWVRPDPSSEPRR